MNLKWFLGLSVVLNVLLVVAMQLQSPAPNKSSPSTSLSSAGSVPEFSHSSRKDWPEDGVNRDGQFGKQKAGPSTANQTVEVDDYPVFVKKLRAAGLSEATIATLLVAEIRDRTIDDNIALQRKFNRGEMTQDDMQKQQRQMQKEQEATLETLLGKDGYRRYQIDHDYQLRQLTATGHFTPESIEKYYDLRKANQDALRELHDKNQAQGIDPTEYQDQTQALQNAYQDELARTLGAGVAAKIRGETDWQVQTLRRQMASVKVNDDEYAQIGQIFQSYQQEQQRLSALQRRGDVSGQDLSPQFQALEQQRKEQLAALLGPQRYTEYEKQQDGTFQQTKQWGKPNGLNDEQIDYVYQVLKNWRQQQQDMQKMRSDPQFKRGDIGAAMEQLNSDTRNTLQGFLGADRYTKFKNATGQVP
ncbi:MAG: hypothetical protein EXS18_03655 [Verrucomicrobiae bacterium]|nr:hypothetical protein [Verrucomicrobiae bacterium]